jgi:hypothetical protein
MFSSKFSPTFLTFKAMQDGLKLINQIFVVAIVDSRRNLEDALWNRLMR